MIGRLQGHRQTDSAQVPRSGKRQAANTSRRSARAAGRGLSPRRRWARLVAIGLGAVVLAVAGAAAWAAATTSYTHIGVAYVSGPGRLAAPAWSRPCWRDHRREHGGFYTLPCGRVHGLVVYRQSVDPDGDGDAHFIVVAGLHVVNVKLPDGAFMHDLPGIGDRVTATGMVSAGRDHVPELRVVGGLS